MSDPRPMRADARRNRAAIVAAARAAFDGDDEPERFDDFAALAGVGVGTLYRHFPTRAALAAAVYRDEVVALCDRGQQLAAEVPAGDALATFLAEFVEHVVASVALARSLAGFVGAPDGPDSADGDLLETTVRDLVGATVPDDVDAATVTGAIMIVLHGIGSTTGRAEWANEARAAVGLVAAGLPVR